MEWAEALWREHSKGINRVLLSYEADRALREDLAQNVFLALLQSVERVRAADNPRAYLFRIAHNIATDHVAREARQRWSPLDGDGTGQLVDPAPTPEQASEHSSDSSRLMAAVRRLKLPLRQVVTLLLEDFNQDEIAEVLKLSPGNVRVRLTRAKQQLEEILRDGN
jgi:RNA polymerase sigma-70 factor (ECF subfamily)